MERLRQRLQQKYGLPTKFVSGKCKSCGAQIEVPGSSSGIKYALLTLASSPRETWQQARELRKDIVHGVATHQSIAGRIPSVLPSLRRALSAAVLDLLDVARVDLNAFDRQPLNPRGPAQVLFTAVITGWQPPSLIGVEDLPFVEVTVSERGPVSDRGVLARRKITFDVTYTAKNLSGSMADTHVELHVAKDPEDGDATLTLTEVSAKRADP